MSDQAWTKNTRMEHDDRWTQVDNYTNANLHLRPDMSNPTAAVLQWAQDNCDKNDLPQIQINPAYGKMLQIQAQILRAKNILEVGTLGGYSTIWLATSSKDVRVTTVEVEAKHRDVARQNLEHAGVGDRVDIRLGPGREVLPQLEKEAAEGRREKFDMVFVDADKVNNWFYFDHAVNMCRPGAAVIVDNVVRQGKLAVAELAETDSNIKGVRQLVENVGEDKRVNGCVIQTVGGKNYDGYLFSTVL